MPIDVSTPRSPGWWLKRLFARLADRHRRERLALLHDYYRGQPPLPVGAENAREAFTAFQTKARSNFASLIASAVSERMMPTGFRTALDDDTTGDAEVGALWERADGPVISSNTHDLMLSMSESYVIVGPVDDETQAPTITCEDPQLMVGEPDPAFPGRLLAALKLVYDEIDSQDRAYLYLPGEVWVATRQRRSTTELAVQQLGPVLAFNERTWDWDAARTGRLPKIGGRIPVVRFTNKDGMGEFEPHLDLLDRINHQILQRMVIATMQAFRQRAVSGLPLTDPRTGQVIDYSDVFTADPAAIWQLPESAKMWESGQVDLTPILMAVKDDVQHLAAVTRTPMHMLMPAGENQSAEGANLQREGLVFKVGDRIHRTSNLWARVMSLALLQAGQSDRADLVQLRTLWAPPQRLSLAERADAASKASGDIPRRSRLIHIWQFSPAEADRMMSEWADDELLAQQVAAAAAAAAPTPAPAAPAGATQQQGQVPEPEVAPPAAA